MDFYEELRLQEKERIVDSLATKNKMLQEPKTPTKEQIRLVRRNLSDYVNSQFSCLHIDTRNMLIYEIITEWEKIRNS